MNDIIVDRPLVTVITVTYNSSKYINDAIKSVLSQHYNKIEYIIGDDCSTDNTWDAIQAYDDSRIIAYRNSVNLGEYNNRNKAIGLAKGQYLIFIDGDDVIFPHGIEYFVNQLEAFPEAAFAVQKNYYNNILFPALLQPKETIGNIFFGNNLLSSSFTSNFFRTDILKNEGMLNPSYRTGDEEIRFRLAAKYPVLFVAGWVSWPRETPGQASSKLQNGIGLAEFCSYVEKELRNDDSIFVDNEFSTSIRNRLVQMQQRLIFRNLKRGKFRKANMLKDMFSLNWVKLLSRFADDFRRWDILNNYTPDQPYKREFLSRNV